MAPLDDGVLVAAAQAGDRRALDDLLRMHHPRIHAVCRRLLGNDADAADAAQEALISVVRGLARFDGNSTFSTWVYRVATNAALDELRRRGRRPAPLARDDNDTAFEPVDHRAHERVDAVADRMLLEAAFGDLRDEFRVAVVLRDVADLDYAEIGEVLGIPPGTVRSRIARGRAALADALEQPAERDDDHGDATSGNQSPSSRRHSDDPDDD